MKKMLSCLILFYASALCAENTTVAPAPSNEELQFVFEKDYLQANDSADLLYLFAGQTLEECQSQLTPTELVEEFKKLASTPEAQEKYLSIYREMFDAEDIQKIIQLLQQEIYLTYRQKISMANFQCHMEARQMLEEIAKKHVKQDSAKPPLHAIPKLTRENKEEIFNSPKPIVLDVYTDWCGPCKYLAPLLEELNQEYGHKYQFVKLNAEEQEELANFYHIEAFPTLIFFKNQQEVGRVSGFMGKQKLLSTIQEFCE